MIRWGMLWEAIRSLFRRTKGVANFFDDGSGSDYVGFKSQWDDPSADPIKDINEAMKKMEKDIGYSPYYCPWCGGDLAIEDYDRIFYSARCVCGAIQDKNGLWWL